MARTAYELAIMVIVKMMGVETMIRSSNKFISNMPFDSFVVPITQLKSPHSEFALLFSLSHALSRIAIEGMRDLCKYKIHFGDHIHTFIIRIFAAIFLGFFLLLAGAVFSKRDAKSHFAQPFFLGTIFFTIKFFTFKWMLHQENDQIGVFAMTNGSYLPMRISATYSLFACLCGIFWVAYGTRINGYIREILISL